MTVKTACPECGSDNKGAPMDPLYFVHYMDADPNWDRKTHTSHEAQIAAGEMRNTRYLAKGQDWMVSPVRCFCLPYGDLPEEDRFYSRWIGVDGGYHRIYDGVIIWICGDCGHLMNRWDAKKENRLWQATEVVILQMRTQRDIAVGATS